METKNICGKIPIELHEKVREEIEGTEMTIPQFLTTVIEEHFMRKGVTKMATRTLAAQVSEELFDRFKARCEKEKKKRGGKFSQKEYMIEIIERFLDAADEEDRLAEEAADADGTSAEEESLQPSEASGAEEVA